jgi:small conductance mechanosensitive channel
MMKQRFSGWAFFRVLALTLFVSGAALAADECPSGIKAQTTADTAVPVGELELRLKPLTRCELRAEADAWLLVLKNKVTEISNAEIAVQYKTEELKKAEEAEKALEDVKEAKADSDQEEVKEASQDAQVALKEAKEAEQKATKEASVKEAMDVALEKAEKEGEAEGLKDDHTAEAKSGMKKALLAHVTDLTAERTALIDRFNVVLAELKAKGGEPKEYETYIKAVSGIKVDVTDASATWSTLTGWLMSAEGGLRWGVNLIQFVLIMIGFYLASIVTGKAAEKAFSRTKNLSVLLREFLVIGIKRTVLFVGFFVGLSALEVNVGPVLAIIGAAGFVIAFALQNSLSNFASGILMLIYRPFDIGEVVDVAGVVGKVESMNLLSTQLRTLDNKFVIVPNNSVWGDVITNVTGITERRIDMVFGIGYDDDIDKAQAILERLVNEHELVLKNPEPVVRLHELGESSVNFICRPWVKPEDYWTVYWDITHAVKKTFDAEGVSIPFPQRDVHIYQEKS